MTKEEATEILEKLESALEKITEGQQKEEPKSWLEQGDYYGKYYDCPVCGEGITEGPNGETPEEADWHYCPYCGARLEGIIRIPENEEQEADE